MVKRAEYEGLGIKSIISVPSVRGYLFVEADREFDVRRLVSAVSRAKLLPGSPVSMEDIETMLRREPEKIELETGDIVKIIKGNFKGYRALVVSPPTGGKGFVTAKLLDINRDWEVRLPVDSIQLEKKAGEVEGEEESEEEVWYSGLGESA